VASARRPFLFVLAGPNGGGKSTLGGAALRESGADYFNPDEEARAIRLANPAIPERAANGAAWQHGRQLLEQAISARQNYAFETTLGGTTITALLMEAAAGGVALHIWFVALATPELHIARVRARKAQGGHDIPEAKIRERYDSSRRNLIRLLPHVTELRLFDNSVEGDPARGVAPRPVQVMHIARGTVAMCPPENVPAWAKPIAAAAVRGDRGRLHSTNR
jgi:predicted ABC-type ATPase